MIVISRILITGDIHLGSRNQGYHKDYASYSLSVFKDITSLVESENITHLIGTGDFSNSLFNLNYKIEIDKELKKQNDLTQGNRYEIKGNHDMSIKGLTEYEYYLANGVLKQTDYLQFNSFDLYMANYGELDKVKVKDPSKKNILICHDYILFDNHEYTKYGTPYVYEELPNLESFDTIIAGHIHTSETHTKGDKRIIYIGSPSRLSIDSVDTYYYCMIEDNEVEPIITFKEIKGVPNEDIYNMVQYSIDKGKKDLQKDLAESTEMVLDVTSLEQYKVEKTQYREVIHNLENVEASIKETAIRLLDQVKNEV